MNFIRALKLNIRDFCRSNFEVHHFLSYIVVISKNPSISKGSNIGNYLLVTITYLFDFFKLMFIEIFLFHNSDQIKKQTNKLIKYDFIEK
jgi:hypothetical protein